MAKRKKRAATSRSSRKKRAQVKRRTTLKRRSTAKRRPSARRSSAAKRRPARKTRAPCSPVAVQVETTAEEIQGGSPPPEGTIATDEEQ
jgi:hypothetical protein